MIHSPSVGLQSPVKNLATAGFQLRPDITIQSGDECVAIFDAKWKRLDLAEPNSGVSSEDAYQMNAPSLPLQATSAHLPGASARKSSTWKLACSFRSMGLALPIREGFRPPPPSLMRCAPLSGPSMC
ncbi:McrC family protein [Paracoccus mutanolyticus]|uniref:McrC family protein n=1 Tax=Paracoccus mutanolyticus TaxID=1499308 RepID=UPI001CB8AB47